MVTVELMKAMKQLSLAETGFLPKAGKQTRKALFLAEMETVVPWSRLKALHDVPLLRQFAGLDAFADLMPNESTILRFRHLLEKHDLAVAIFAEVNAALSEQGLSIKHGTVVDATLIAAPSSTKNGDKQPDPEMTQTKKGNQWQFGMKAHIGVDADSGLVHTVVCTNAKVEDITMMEACLHGEESQALGDRGYHKKNRTIDDFEQEGALVVLTPTKKPAGGALTDEQKAFNWMLSAVRAIVEHPFRVVKRQFGFVKVRYRGLAKNTGQIVTLFALANLWLARKRLLPLFGDVRP
jgi:IS5 family transposase